MSWDLTTMIDLSGDRFEFIKTLIDFFDSDLENIQYEVILGWLPNEQILEKGNISWDINVLSIIENLLNQYSRHDNTYRCINIGLGLYGYGELGGYSPYPEISFKSSAYGKGVYGGQESDAVLLFGNHKAYRGESSLPKSGRFLDRNFVTETLKYICQKIKPKNLYLLSEEHVYIPWNYHFIFHNSPQGYAQDLADIIQLVLQGGDERYVDDRRNYNAGVSENFGMTFCKRNRGHIKVLQDYMLDCGSEIEKQGLLFQVLSEELIEDALLEIPTIPGEDADPSMDFFFVGDGLGVYAQPLLDRYLDLFFLALMSRVRGEGAFLETASIT
jgi:hypothetical protein